MDRIWAPWRLAFVEGADDKPKGCIFCLFPAERRDRERLVLGRSEHAFAILNKYPYNNGHLMVVPRRHVADPADLDEAEWDDLQRLLRTSVAILKQAYGPDALNLGMNLGRAAGAGIADHLHWHAVPRWSGDTNFMPVLAETRVIPEHLDATWEKLRPLFDRALA